MGLLKKAVKYTTPVGFVAAKTAEVVKERANDPDRQAEKARREVETPVVSSPPESAHQDALPEGAVYQAMDHTQGRNAIVTLFPDRIERVKPRSRMSFQSTAQDVDMIPLRMMSGFGTQVPAFTRAEMRKANMRFSNIILHGANGSPNVVFHFKHDDASAFQTHINRALMEANAPVKPEVDVTDRLLKLAQLRDANIISNEEFEAKKAELVSQL